MTPDDLSDMLDDGEYGSFVDAICADPRFAKSEPELLIKAVNLSQLKCVEVLLQNGANANPTSESPFAAGKSLLLMAIGFGDYEIARRLLEYGADPDLGFQGPPDYEIFLSSYAPSGFLTSTQFSDLINEIRAGRNPVPRKLR